MTSLTQHTQKSNKKQKTTNRHAKQKQRAKTVKKQNIQVVFAGNGKESIYSTEQK